MQTEIVKFSVIAYIICVCVKLWWWYNKTKRGLPVSFVNLIYFPWFAICFIHQKLLPQSFYSPQAKAFGKFDNFGSNFWLRELDVNCGAIYHAVALYWGHIYICNDNASVVLRQYKRGCTCVYQSVTCWSTAAHAWRSAYKVSMKTLPGIPTGVAYVLTVTYWSAAVTVIDCVYFIIPQCFILLTLNLQGGPN